MKRKYRIRKSFHISTLLALSIIAVAVVGMSITGFSLTKLYSSFLRKSAISSNEEVITQVNKNIDFYISDIISVGDYTKMIVAPDSSYPVSDLRISLETLKDSHKDITGIGIFDLDGNPLIATAGTISNRGIPNEEWFLKAKESDDEEDFFFSIPHKQNLAVSVRDRVISYSRRIRMRRDNEEIQAILLIDLNLVAISEITEHGFADHNTGYIYIISNDGKIVYHPKMVMIESGDFSEDIESVRDYDSGSFTSFFGGEERLTVIEPIAKTDWKIIGVESLDAINSLMNAFRAIIIISYFIIIVITVIFSRSIARNITGPIRQLEESMRSVQVGNFAIVPPHEGTKEVQSLSNSFSIMIDKIVGLMNDIKKTEEIKRQRELDALQAKINPHFLYNTLETIIWLAETGDSKGVVKTVSSLASLFRISIAKGHDVITIQEEFDHVRHYLEIQMMRYRDKFDYEISVPDSLRNCPTIKLIVQPVVENSIYHGIKYLQDKGHISISAAEAGSNIEITVQDNGVGMDQETAAALLDPDAHIERSGNGIGLINIDERLKLSYGKEYGLSIWSEREVGTTVIITIPHLRPIDPVLIKPISQS
mgnify:CR=1 FL=1